MPSLAEALAAHGGNKAAAARALGMPVSTLKDALKRAGSEIDQNAGQNGAYASEIRHLASDLPKPRIRVKAWTRETRQASETPVIRVLALGDAHDRPGRCKERFKWFGRHAAQTRPDHIVSIGDFGSFDSLSGHEVPGSQNDADRFAFHEELDSLDQALSAFHSEIAIGEIPVSHCHGNHEERAWAAANRQPKLCGDLPFRVDGVFARYRWQTHRYGQVVVLYDCEWVHTPLNKMGKASNSDLAERLHGNRQVRDLIVGHTHIANVVTVIKNNNSRVRVVNLGTCMPWNTVERYSSRGASDIDYCLVDLRIKDGQIIGWRFMDMLEVEAAYS